MLRLKAGNILDGATIASDAWVQAHPRGAYTTVRTTGNNNMVLELSAHIARLAESAHLMHVADFGLAELRPTVLRVLSKAIYDAHTSNHLKLTLLLYPDAAVPHTTLHLDCHVQPLPAPPAPPIVVQLGGAPRSNAHAKDSAWVETRRQLVAAQCPGVHETVLVGAQDGLVYEGLSSNVFAVMVLLLVVYAHTSMYAQSCVSH